MAQFDVYRLGQSITLVVDCQSDLLSHLDVRFVVPLHPAEVAPRLAARLNPVFEIVGEHYVLMPQLATSIARRLLRDPVQSLADDDVRIIGAIDTLLRGV